MTKLEIGFICVAGFAAFMVVVIWWLIKTAETELDSPRHDYYDCDDKEEDLPWPGEI